jgi:hypothetical protein
LYDAILYDDVMYRHDDTSYGGGGRLNRDDEKYYHNVLDG